MDKYASNASSARALDMFGVDSTFYVMSHGSQGSVKADSAALNVEARATGCSSHHWMKS